MKLILIMVFLFCLSCTKSNKDDVSKEDHSTAATIGTESNIARDTLDLVVRINDSTKVEINEEVYKRYEEWFKGMAEIILPPDAAWEEFISLDKYRDIGAYFTSEAGQDDFYILYAHFLQKKNGVERQAELRQKILKIYNGINDLSRRLQYGGTYFGHQGLRLYGYTEYSVYNSDDDSYIKEYNIDKQKALFIQSLRQTVLDEEQFDFNTIGNEKIKRRKELMKIIDDIGLHIKTFYDLRIAQEFKHSHYNWL